MAKIGLFTRPSKLNTVKLNWEEVYYTSCPLVSASNVDQELGWTKEEWFHVPSSFTEWEERRLEYLAAEKLSIK